MRIGGFQKNSMIDFPGIVSSVVFTDGCNFRCPYCHNPDLVKNTNTSPYKNKTFLIILENDKD